MPPRSCSRARRSTAAEAWTNGAPCSARARPLRWRMGWSASQSRLPRTERLDVGRRSVACPAVELCLILQLLATLARHDGERTRAFGQRGHVAPEFFKLRDGIDVLLTVAPALLHVLERDVRRHACGDGTYRGGRAFRRIQI